MKKVCLTKVDGGLHFEDGDDRGRIIVSGDEVDNQYSLMEWILGATDPQPKNVKREYFPHRHDAIEETFFIQAGELEFLIEDDVIALGPGDHIRVPPGTRHGYANPKGHEVRMLVTFVPGGFEQLFVKYRTDQSAPTTGSRFIEDAETDFESYFER